MKERIIQLFEKKSRGSCKIVFVPELKVKRNNDILYISEIYELSHMGSTKTFFVHVEIGCCNNFLAVPLGIMDDLSLKAIYLRLAGTGEKLLEIENKQ